MNAATCTKVLELALSNPELISAFLVISGSVVTILLFTIGLTFWLRGLFLNEKIEALEERRVLAQDIAANQQRLLTQAKSTNLRLVQLVRSQMPVEVIEATANLTATVIHSASLINNNIQSTLNPMQITDKGPSGL